MYKPFALILIIALLLAGCARSAPKPNGSDPPASPEATAPTAPTPEPNGQPAGALADAAPLDLLPQPDTRYAYRVSDGTTAEEYYTRDGERLIGA